MSNIYVQEPPTNGKVLMMTTVGDIDIELWSKEAPKACRNFVQLCMEGYYNGTTFFRVVREFIVQGGDPTNTGHGGESIYGKHFQDEFHSRLRFVRRGLVAMANAGPNDNGSQFFFTLAATPELTNKHTIFGRVVGNTIFNMIKLGEVTTDRDERPTNPHRILKTEVLHNPFDDIEVRTVIKNSTKEKAASLETSSKATKNFSLLSFGEEAEVEEEEVTKVAETLRHKGKSSHDLLNDIKLSSVPAVDFTADNKAKNTPENLSDNEEDVTVKGFKKEYMSDKIDKAVKPSEENKPGKISSKIKGIVYKNEALLTSTDTARKVETPQKLKGKHRQDATLKLLEKFKSKLEAAKKIPQPENIDTEAEEKYQDQEESEGDLGWMNHKLQFEEKAHKVMDANIQDSERYEISDPRNPMVVRRRHKDKVETGQKRQKTEK